MQTLEKAYTFSDLLEELARLREQQGNLLKQKNILEGEIMISQNEVNNLIEETKTVYVEADEVVFEIQKRSQQETTHLSLKTKDSGGVAEYFYSKEDNMPHQATGWHSYYFYDEKSKAHSQNNVYKIIATSDPEQYPNLGMLTVKDLLKKTK